MKDGGTQFLEWTEKMKEKYVPGYVANFEFNPFIPKCPTCGSPNIRRLHTSEAAFDGAQLIGHANWTFKTFVCNNCGYAW